MPTRATNVVSEGVSPPATTIEPEYTKALRATGVGVLVGVAVGVGVGVNVGVAIAVGVLQTGEAPADLSGFRLHEAVVIVYFYSHTASPFKGSHGEATFEKYL